MLSKELDGSERRYGFINDIVCFRGCSKFQAVEAGPVLHTRSVASKRPPVPTPGYYVDAARTYSDVISMCLCLRVLSDCWEVSNSITTPPQRHRQSENMARPRVNKPPATTTYSPDSPARRHDRQDGGGLGRRSQRRPNTRRALRLTKGYP